MIPAETRTLSRMRVVILASCILFGSNQIALAQSVLGGSKFPIIITKPGSYILKHNLVPPANTTAINIQASNVSLDLNGFAIIGTPSSPTVWAIQSTSAGVIVRNGQVTGLCLSLGQNALVEDVLALNCAMTAGVIVGSNSSVSRSVATSDFIE
jgi:hypothetical protein